LEGEKRDQGLVRKVPGRNLLSGKNGKGYHTPQEGEKNDGFHCVPGKTAGEAGSLAATNRKKSFVRVSETWVTVVEKSSGALSIRWVCPEKHAGEGPHEEEGDTCSVLG